MWEQTLSLIELGNGIREAANAFPETVVAVNSTHCYNNIDTLN